MQEKNIETLVINKVENQEVYDAMVAANKINSNELYLVGGGEQVTGVKGANETTYRTGNVNLTAENVGALSKDTKIPSKTSDLTNDSDYATNTSVDTKLNDKVSKDGDTMTGALKFTNTAGIQENNGDLVVGKIDGARIEMYYDSMSLYSSHFNLSNTKSGNGATVSLNGTNAKTAIDFGDYFTITKEISDETQMKIGNGLYPIKIKTGDITLGDTGPNNEGSYIHNLKIPAADTDAANKKYVDDAIANNTVDISEATTDTSGLMSAADKVKLNAIEEGANKTTVDDALSSTSTNPVQNKVINTKLTTMQTDIDSKVDKDGNKVLSTNDFTTALKNNLNSAYTHSTSAHAPSNAERNTIITIKRNGTALTPTNRVVDITVPTKTSDLTNDSDFATNSSVDTKLANKVTVVSGKGLSTEDYTSAEKTKLSGIATGAEVNQNAFSNVVIGKTTVAADSKTDTLTLISGSNVTLTPDATNDTITIAATDTVYTHPTATRNNTTSTASPAHGKTFTAIDSITTNGTGHVTAVNTKTVTLPTDSDTLGKNIVGTATTSTANGAVTGNGVYLNHIEGTGTVKSTHKITGGGATKVTSDANGNITITSTDSDTVYTHPTYTRSNTTSTGSPAHGGTFTAIDGITTNNLGHVTAVNTKTVTLPAAPVTSVNSKTGAVSLTASDVGALPLSGGTLTGNLTGKYITGTWLQTTAATDKAGRIATIDNDGWIYYRTLTETKGDLGISDNLVKYDSNTTVEATTKVNADTLEGHATSYFVPKSGGTMTGALVAQTNTNYTTAQMRNVIISTADPSGGNNGDIWLKYEA